MYDISNIKSFRKLNNWVNDISNYSNNYENNVKVIVGSKKDLKREVPYDEGKLYANSNEANFYEISSKDEDDYDLIKQIFFDIGIKLKNKPPKKIKKSIKIEEKKTGFKNPCC